MGLLVRKGYFYTYRFLLRWKTLAFISFPIILLPIMILSHFRVEARCGYVLLLVTVYWIFDVIPLAVTALLPIALLPMLGVMPSSEVSPAYMKDINMLLFAGIACAVGVEYSNLHRRIALKVLLTIGTKPRWLFMGFLLTTCFLSMWINNTASTAMMTPIADSVLLEMYPFENPDDTEEERALKRPSNTVLVKEAYNMRNGILLCICSGANLGGTGTMTGTGPNLIMAHTVDTAFPGGEVPMNYLLWMAFCTPNMIICMIIMWVIFQIVFLGFRKTFTRATSAVDQEATKRTKQIIRDKYKELGSMTFHEVTILIVFLILVLLWIFREPGFTGGWTELIENKMKVKDSAAAVIALTLMFILPSIPDWWWSDIKDRSLDPAPPRSLTWEIIHARFSWGVVFILGGGFAMADACRISGLSKLIADWLLVLEGTSPILLCFTVMVFTVTLTTITSNTATATILLPIMIELAYAMKIAPLFLLLPTTLASSFSYVLPISTPPNAIVYERSNMTIAVMAKTGIWSAIVCIVTTTLMISFYAPLVFDLEGHPQHPT